MRVAITGSTGLLGETLMQHLQRTGHEAIRVVRSHDRATGDHIYWSVVDGEIEAGRFEDVDAVVHLAGEPIGTNRWTREVKRRIHDSRARGTRLLAEALASLDDPPGVLVSQSGVDYYGDRGSDILTEDEPPGDTFLARVCVDWEQASTPAAEAGIRVVNPRTGVVIASEGPLLEKVSLPFSIGVGGRVGSGEQYYPWISLEDEIRALVFLLEGQLSGPVNLTGPAPVTNAEFTKALGEVMNRPTVMPVPVTALRVLYGEMGVTLGTESKRAVPRRLLDAGFTFRHETILEALRAAL